MATNKKKKKYTSFTDYTKDTLNLSDDAISPVVDKANPKTYNQKVNTFATIGDISPIKADTRSSFFDGWFKKSEGNKQDAILGTTSDALLQTTTGVVGMGEKFVDALGAMASAGYTNQLLNVKGYLTPEDLKTADKMKKDSVEAIKKDLYDEKAVASKILAGLGRGMATYSSDPNGYMTMEDFERAKQTGKDIEKYLNEDVEKYSVLDEKAQGLFQSAGQLGATALASPVMPWYLTTGITSFGGQMEESLNEGATFEEAVGSSLISAGAEVLSEKLSGGISFGGKTLDDGLTNVLAKNISNKGLRALSKIGMDFAGEGAEEVVSQFFSNLGTALYKEENLGEILASEEAVDEYITSFISGGILGGVSSAGKTVKSAKTGTDVLTGYSKNEQAVFDKVVENRIKELEQDGKKLTSKEKNKIYEEAKEDFEKGDIDIDTIESVLGGETLNKYKSIEEQETSLTKKLQELENSPNTVGNSKQYDSIENQLKELQSKNEKAQLKEQLSKEVYNMTVNDSVIQRSYEQDVKRKSDYTADLTKYTPEQQKTIQRAIDSGILNDSRKTHEFVDLVAKVSAEKGVSFDFLNNERIRESGFALEGKRVNGFKNGNTISINMESRNALNSVVGHEITHVLEGSPELYNAMAESVKDFGEAKGIYQEMYDTAFENYKNVYKDMSEEDYKKAIEKEVTADLVAEYIFSDIDFVRGLSTKNRNVFQKVYDEIKYFLKSVTTGSDAEKKLLKAKKMFEEVYRESGKASETSDTTVKEDGHEDGDVNVQYSVQVEDQDTIDFLENQEHIVTYKAMQLIDGKLYPPMAAKVKGENGRYQLTNPSELGKWQQATEDAKNIKKFKNGVGYYTLNKGDGTSVDAAYNPYEHSSNLVLNDQFESAHRRPNLVTVEGVIPTSEMSSGYKAEYAKDSTGVMDWHSGVVAGKLQDNKRQVYLSRYFKPVRIMEDSEVATKYKEILDGQGVSVPFNVVSPSLLSELEKAGVDIDYNGSPMYQHYAKKAAEKKGVKYSVSDSNGNELSDAQKEYFADSKIKDENGNLKVMYHGSQESFTVFDKKKAKSSGLYGKGFYFTESKSHAQQYGSQYEVYLNITNPIQNGTNNITKEQLRNFVEALAEDEDYGIENYGYGATVDSITDDVYGKDDFAMLMDLNVTCVGNMVEAIELFNEVNGTDYNGIVAPTETVAFYPNQIKKIDNQSPTSDSDIRFSLSQSVEETKDLVAVHNLRGTELMKTMELGGLPMPSIAVIKAQDGHEMYGDVTLILPKDTIDPKTNKANKVYGGDAWTPIYPKIEYKPNAKVEKKISDKYYDFADRYGYDEARPLYRYVYELEDALNREGGEEALLERLYDDTNLMQVFLQDTGKEKVQDVVKETETKISEAEAEMNQFLLETLGSDFVTGFKAPEGKTIQESMLHRRTYLEEHEAEIRDAYAKLCKEVYGFTNEEVGNVLDNTDRKALMKIMRDVYMYSQNNGVTVKTETDYEATKEAIRNAAKDGYKEWVDSLFKGAEEKTGIRNNTDVLDRYGNKRSWDALHWENTLENVVRVMKQQDNGQAFFAGSSIWGVSAKEYGSIQEIKSDSGRLRKMSDEEYAEVKESYQNRLSDIAAKIMSKTERNQFMALDNAMECIVDSIRVSKNPKGLFKELKQYTQLNVTEQDAIDIIALVKDIANMPTGYFEAKPQRAVELDEVGVFVIPNNADAKLKQKLLNKGYSIAEYNPDIEGDRTRVVNEFEKYKFSLSDTNQGKTPRRRGYYSEDVLLKRDNTQEAVDDIAPVAADHNANVSKMVQDDFVEDYAPLTEVEANVRDDRQIEEHYFPDDMPTEEPEEIYNGNYADHMKPADPFYEKDIFEVGKDRKQKAYMYENPEVKPFFQEEARYMLGELDNSSKGERFYNDQLYYDTNGEYGIFGTKRHTSEEIAYLLDTFNYTYKDIAKGLNAIIEDNGKENNAISKRIEFLLDERLRLGYKDFWFGDRVPPNQEYINLLNEKQINEYNDESFSNWVQNLSDEDIRYFTQREEMIASDPSEYAPEEIAPQTPEEILYSLEESQAAVLEEMDQKVDAVEEEDTPELSVDEQYSASVENYRTSIEGYNNSRSEIEKAFDDVIAKKQAEYDGLKRKDTQRASNLLMQMENLRLRKANNLSKFDSRIERTQKRLDKMIAEEDAVKERMYGKRRKESHEGIVNNIKSHFASKGLDLDTVLGKAKNLSTFSTVDNTPQRVMEKSLGYKEGQALADMTVNKVAQNESEGVRWVNGIVKELKQISKEYGIKPRSKESAAAQKFAEGYYVDENDQVRPYKEEQLKADFPDVRKRENIKKLASDPRIRRIYDDALDSINESRRKNHYKEIPKRANYFLHSMEKSDIFSRLGTPFNPQDIGAADLPTDINGMTADFKPGQPYFASANARKGYKTTYDLLGGVEKYVNNAKNQIYHIEDIQTLRALRNYIADMYGQAKGFEGLDEMSNVEVAERIEQIQSNHLSSFAKFLNEEANIIAGKTSLIDRGLEGIIGRRGIKVVDTINRQVGSNMVGFNVSSALTNVVSGVQAMAKSNKFDVLKAFTQTVSNRIGSIYGKTDGFTEENSGYVRRQGIDRFSSRPVDKVNDAGYFLMGAVDQVTSEFILRTKYNELTRKGMSSEQAHIEADKWASRILGDRSIGQQPQLYNSKMLGLITKFQLEVRNQLDSQFYDTYQDAKTTSDNHLKTAAKVGKTVFELAVLQHIFGTAFESVTGYNPAFDLIEVLMTAIGADDDEESEDTALDNIEQGFLALMEDLPYTSTLTGGRIPIESALPIKELITGENDYGQEVSRAETLKEVAPYYMLPTGYGQIKKTSQGLGMFDEDLPVSGSYTDSGNLRFPVKDTTKNRVAAGLFGQYANENARDYFDNERSPLKEKQIQEYKDLELPIREYWDYREGLKKQDKLEDKFEYVNDLDVSIEQKNIMINNIVDRKEKVDMSNYDDFANYEEFDWYTKNTEKYNFLEENGVSYAEYKADKDTKEQYDSDYSIYKNNPEEVTMSKAVAGNFLEYRSYMRDLYEIRADKDSRGNSISGTAKAKKQAYIESLPLDAGQKIILHRSLYDSKKDKAAYDRQIVEYLNSRDDITQEEMETILKELDIW